MINTFIHLYTNTTFYIQWRSPEEYLYKHQTEAIDVYSLGHILNFILTGNVPFGNLTTGEAIAYVKQGGRMYVTDVYFHPLETSIIQAMERCFEFDPKKRATAREVTNLLRIALEELE